MSMLIKRSDSTHCGGVPECMNMFYVDQEMDSAHCGGVDMFYVDQEIE